MLFTSLLRPLQSRWQLLSKGHARSRERGKRPRRFRLDLERLEDRTVPSTFTVTNTGDNGGVNPAPGAGTGTLRQAIVDANAAATGTATNPDLVQFKLPASDPQPSLLPKRWRCRPRQPRQRRDHYGDR